MKKTAFFLRLLPAAVLVLLSLLLRLLFPAAPQRIGDCLADREKLTRAVDAFCERSSGGTLGEAVAVFSSMLDETD